MHLVEASENARAAGSVPGGMFVCAGLVADQLLMMWRSHVDQEGYNNAHSEPDEHFHRKHSRQKHLLSVAANILTGRLAL
jgi:hypothetical protein